MMTEAEKQQQETDFIRSMVLRKFPLLGVTMSSLKTVADDSIGTAATDGKTVYYSPRFFSNLSDDEKTFIYAHEVMHVAFNHILRSKDRNAKLWNTATDSVINQILKSEGLPMVEGGVDMAEAINRSAEEMYEKLLNEKRQNQQSKQQDQSKSQQGQSDQNQEQKQEQSGQGQNQEQEQQKQEPQDEQPQQNNSSGSSQNQDNERQPENNNSDQGNGDGEESEQAGHDNHDIWKKAVEDAEKEQQRQQQAASQKSLLDKIKEMLGNKKTPQETPPQESEQKQSSSQAADGQRAKGSESTYERNFLAENAEERRQQAEQIRRKLERRKNETIKAQAENSCSSFGPVGKAKAVTDWKKLLKKSITEDEDRWSYRRSDADNDYMARVEELEDENKSETEVMLDVSGSVNEEMLKEFLRQLKPILKNSKLKVGCFDHRLYDFREIKNDRDIDNFPIFGGGGTNIDLAVRAFSKKKEINKIVFTDGYSNDMPKNDLKNMNVIWLIYDNDNFHPVCGKVIYVDKRQIANAKFASIRSCPSRGGR